MFKITRLYCDENGESRFENQIIAFENSGEIGSLSQLYSAEGIIFREVPATYKFDFHNTPRRQYVIFLDGEIEIETSLGEIRRFKGGDVLLAEDTTGKGHKTKNITSEKRRTLFIPIQ
jgi:hypothetical protein